MGFFGDLAGIALPVLGSVLGGPAGSAAGGALATLFDEEDDVIATQATNTVAGAATQLVQGPAGTAISLKNVGRMSTGGLRRRTIVQTFNPRTGAVVKSETMKGAPAVMNSDVAAANRLNRQLRRLNKKQPRKLVKQSTRQRLLEEAENASLRRIAGPRHAHGGEDIVVVK